jgi:hypothetical protein
MFGTRRLACALAGFGLAAAVLALASPKRAGNNGRETQNFSESRDVGCLAGGREVCAVAYSGWGPISRPMTSSYATAELTGLENYDQQNTNEGGILLNTRLWLAAPPCFGKARAESSVTTSSRQAAATMRLGRAGSTQALRFSMGNLQLSIDEDLAGWYRPMRCEAETSARPQQRPFLLELLGGTRPEGTAGRRDTP